MIDLGQIANNKIAQVAGEIIAQGQHQGLFRRSGVKNIPDQSQHHDQKWKKAQQHAGPDRQRVDMHFGLRKIANGRPPTLRFDYKNRGRIFSDDVHGQLLLTYMVVA